MQTPTARQWDVYEFIKQSIRQRGISPSFREIGARFDIASPNGVKCHLVALAKKGWIKWEPSIARSIKLVAEATICPCCGREMEDAPTNP